MNRKAIITIMCFCLLTLLVGCSSPAKKQQQAAQEYMLTWSAFEFEKLCKNAVKLGMTSKEVLFQWGAPTDQKSFKNDQGEGMTWTYKVDKIMYFRGYNQNKGVSKSTMLVTLINDKVTEIQEK